MIATSLLEDKEGEVIGLEEMRRRIGLKKPLSQHLKLKFKNKGARGKSPSDTLDQISAAMTQETLLSNVTRFS